MYNRSILISNGWITDQNFSLAETVIPSTVKTLNAPTKITFMGNALNWIPSTSTALQELECTNAELSIGMKFDSTYTALETVKMNNLLQLNQAVSGSSTGMGYFCGCTKLKSLQFNRLQSITFTGYSTDGIFKGCTGLTSLSLPELTIITETASRGSNSFAFGTFYGCTGITSISAPKLQQISCSASETSGNICGTFKGCTGLSILNLPSLQSIISGGGGAFAYCTGLTDVTLGSDGHPVTSLSYNTFYGCSQSGLTITIYTADGNAIAGAPWGATNATIIWEEA